MTAYSYEEVLVSWFSMPSESAESGERTPRFRGMVGSSRDDQAKRMSQRHYEEVLSFWLDAPASTAEGLMKKMKRWYQGGPALDLEIETRFGSLLEQALGGGLEDWLETPRGRLALVVVLDQFARNVHRGTARAHAGDARALSLALSMLERGDAARFNLEEQLFTIMPLIHAENVAMQDRGVELADRMVTDAPTDELRATWSFGAARTRHYRDVIGRFGRFPGRNAALGRPSTDEELAFLREQEQAGSPLG